MGCAVCPEALGRTRLLIEEESKDVSYIIVHFTSQLCILLLENFLCILQCLPRLLESQPEPRALIISVLFDDFLEGFSKFVSHVRWG